MPRNIFTRKRRPSSGTENKVPSSRKNGFWNTVGRRMLQFVSLLCFCVPKKDEDEGQVYNHDNEGVGVTKAPSGDKGSKAEAEEKKSTAQLLRDKKKQAMITLQWLEENYCVCEGVCLPRNVLYAHYLDFCQKNSLDPACAATFGKAIRQKFPQLTTRRLGTRGHSKYHYYGIGIRETSQYYNAVYNSAGLTKFSGSELQNEGGFTRKYTIGSKVGTLLPEFPNASFLILPDNVSSEKVDTFLMMYRTHCQCVLDTTISGSFKEIETFLLHFWQGLPTHMKSLLTHAVIENVICLCDSILAKTMMDVLIPSTMQEMPETLLCDIRNLATQWPRWVASSLEALPTRLRDRKLLVARRFSLFLKHQGSFLHLAQTARPVLYNGQLVTQMILDLDALDSDSVCKDFAAVSVFNQLEAESTCDVNFADEVLKEFKDTLRRQATVESFIEWLDSLLEAKVIKKTSQSGSSMKDVACDFMLNWSLFGTRVSHCLTLSNSTSFGSVHLVRLLLDEYVYLAVESQRYREQEEELERQVQTFTHTDESGTYPKYSSVPGSSFVATERQISQGSAVRPDTSRSNSATRSLTAESGAVGVAGNVEGNRWSLPLPPGHLASLNYLTQRLHPEPTILTPPHSPMSNAHSNSDVNRGQHCNQATYSEAAYSSTTNNTAGHSNAPYPLLHHSFNPRSRDYDMENMQQLYQHFACGNYMRAYPMQGFSGGFMPGMFSAYMGFTEDYQPTNKQENYHKNHYYMGRSESTKYNYNKEILYPSYDWYRQPGSMDEMGYGDYSNSCRQSAQRACNQQEDMVDGSRHMFSQNNGYAETHQSPGNLYYQDSINNLSAVSANPYY